MYCTRGKVASCSLSAAVVSAISSPLTRTWTRPRVGSMVIGCPALGSLISGWLMFHLSVDDKFNVTRRATFPSEAIAVVLGHRPQPGHPRHHPADPADSR